MVDLETIGPGAPGCRDGAVRGPRLRPRQPPIVCGLGLAADPKLPLLGLCAPLLSANPEGIIIDWGMPDAFGLTADGSS